MLRQSLSLALQIFATYIPTPLFLPCPDIPSLSQRYPADAEADLELSTPTAKQISEQVGPDIMNTDCV